MLRRIDDKTIVSEIGLWLMKKGIPYQRYDNLQSHHRIVLQNLVCIPTCPTTSREREDLYKALCLLQTRGDSSDFMPDDEEIVKFFTPLAPSERLSYYDKF